MTLLPRGKEGQRGLEGLSSSACTLGQARHPVLWEGWCWTKFPLKGVGGAGAVAEGAEYG